MTQAAESNRELDDEKYCGGGSRRSQFVATRPESSKFLLELDSRELREDAHGSGSNGPPDVVSSMKDLQNMEKFVEQPRRPGDEHMCSNVAYGSRRSLSSSIASLEGPFSEVKRAPELCTRQQRVLPHHELENSGKASEGELKTSATSTSTLLCTLSPGSLENHEEEGHDFKLLTPGCQGTATLKPVPCVSSDDLRTPSERNGRVDSERGPVETSLQGAEASILEDVLEPRLTTMPGINGEPSLLQQWASGSEEPEEEILDDVQADPTLERPA
ncbi:hypothetical protein MRX96_033519 [Rhipicephalus microplus]